MRVFRLSLMFVLVIETQSSVCTEKDCIVETWQSWGVCTKTCGGGSYQRKRNVSQKTCTGVCPQPSIETKSCNTNCCPVNCEYDTWSNWGNCFGDCNPNKGSQTRSRKVKVKGSCSEHCDKTSETRVCTVTPVSCKYGEWGNWSACSNECGPGLKMKTRRIQIQSQCSSNRCLQSELQITEQCNSYKNIDCNLTEWSSWSSCSTGCGVGFTQRYRSILQPPKCNGNPCGVLFENKTCTSFASSKKCLVGEWSSWGQCQSDCSFGVKKRIRYIVSQPVCLGERCPKLEEISSCGEPNKGCNHLCTAGKCSCFPGFEIENKTKCIPKDCGLPLLDSCQAKDHSCWNPSVICPKNNTFYPASCTLECPLAFELHGEKTIYCQESGKWTPIQSICKSVNKAPSQLILSNDHFVENLPSSSVIGKFYTVDANKKDTHTYILANDGYGYFTVVNDQLITLKPFDFEDENKRFKINIKSTDSGYPPLSIEETFYVSLRDVNENPTDILLSGNSIKENSKEDVLVGTLTAVDVDANQLFLFRLIDSSDGLFVIENNEIKTSLRNAKCTSPLYPADFCLLNFESKKVHNVTIEVVDNGVPSLSFVKSFSIYLLDVNDPPYNFQLSSNSVKENSAINTFIGQFSAQDEENQTLSFVLLDDDNSSFTLSSGKLYKSKSSNYETTKMHRVLVQVSDDGHPVKSLAKWFIINVEDENEPPIVVIFSPNFQVTLHNKTEIRVLENMTTTNYNIGKFVVYDADHIEVIEAELLDTFNGTFSLPNATHFSCVNSTDFGAQSKCDIDIYLNKNLDFEARSSYSVDIKILDRNYSIQYSFKVSVMDCNDAPTSILINGVRTASIYENSLGATVGLLTTVDPDSEQQHKYELQDNFNYFEINDNVLKLKKNISADYENQSYFIITIKSFDNGIPSQWVVDKVIVNILDSNDPPTNITLSSFKIDENVKPDTKFAEIIIFDEDTKTPDSTSHPCSLLNSTFFRILDNVLYVSMAADFEQDSSILVILLCQDQFINVEYTFVITVNDINEAPTAIMLSTQEYAENISPPQVIAALITIDPDSSLDRNQQSFTYKVLTNQDQITVKGSNLIALQAFNFEVLPFITFKIEVFDSGNLTLTEIKTIKILDQNDPPSDILISNNRLEENTLDGTVGILIALDEDKGQKYFCHEINSFQSSFFVNSNILMVKEKETQKVFNAEKNPVLVIPIICTDNGSPRYSINKSLSIYVADVNDPPYNLTLSSDSTNEMDPIGTIIGRFNANDEDVGQNLSYSLVGGDSQYFLIERQNLVKFAHFKHEGVYRIVVEALDNGSPQLKVSSDFLVKVVSKNKNTINTIIRSDGGEFSENNPKVPEHSNINDTVGTIIAYSTDSDSLISFTLMDNASGYFRLNDFNPNCSIRASDPNFIECKLTLLVNKKLNYEEQDKHSITVHSQNGKGSSYIATFVISVIDQNDMPTNIFLNGQYEAMCDENIVGAYIADITTEDEDKDQLYEYAIVETYAEKIFEIYNNKLFLKKNLSLDFEIKSFLNFSIKSTDNGNPKSFVIQNVTVAVQDVNEVPTSISLTNNWVVENSAPLTFIASVNVRDPDNLKFVKQTHFCWVTESSLMFRINQNIGNSLTNDLILLKNGLHYEIVKSISVSIHCEDSGIPSQTYQERFTLNVTDVNEPPNEIQLSSNSIAENTEPLIFATFSTKDPDNFGNLQQYFNYTLLNATVPFEILGNKLKAVSQLDYETQSEWLIFVQSTDSGVPPMSLVQSFKIFIIDINEAPNDILLSDNTVSENSKKGTIVALLTAIDVDCLKSGDKQQHTYILLENPGSVFRIVGNKLQVNEDYGQCSKSQSCILNFERNSVLNIKIRVVDDGKPVKYYDKSFLIHVADINESPWNLTLSSVYLQKNSPRGSIICKISVIDEDQNQTIKFDLIENSGIFNIDSDSNLVLNETLSFESPKVFTIKINASDNGKPSLSIEKSFMIYVENKNEAPVKLRIINKNTSENFPLDLLQVSENLPVATLIGTLEIIYNGSIQNLKLELLDNTDKLRIDTAAVCLITNQRADGSITICNATIVTSAILNFEETPSIKFTLYLQDPFNLTYFQTYELKVVDQNDKPTDITIEQKHIAFVKENSPNEAIGILETTDEDFNQNHNYSIENNYHFVIKSNSKESWLYTSFVSLDYEESQIQNITIKSTDYGNPSLSFEQQIIIQVLDVNEAPTDIILSNLVLAENSPLNSHIGIISVVDPDTLSNQSHNCSLDGFRLKIQNMLLSTNSQFDYEVSPNETINLICTDNGEPAKSFRKSFTIIIEDVNEAPTDILMTNQIIPENLDNYEIGKFVVSDPDLGDSHNITLVGEYFEIFGNRILASRPLNYEDKSVYSINVTATDSKGLSVEKSFKIFVEDRNDPPSGINCSFTSISETSLPGIDIGFCNAVDEDKSQKHTFSITNIFASGLLEHVKVSPTLFKIDQTSGVLVLGDKLSYNYSSNYTITINVTDDGIPELSIENNVTIFIGDVLHAPTDILLSSTNVYENSPVGTLIGNINVIDPDNIATDQSTHFCECFEKNEMFEVNDDHQLVVKFASLDFETISFYEVNVSCFDLNFENKSISRMFFIQVLNLNEAPSISLKPSSIDENNSPGNAVAVFDCKDPDNVNSIVDNLTITSFNSFGSPFLLKPPFYLVADITLDYEKASLYTIEVTVEDNGAPSLSLTKNISIYINDLNDPPISISLSSISFNESLLPGTIVATILVKDPDSYQNHVCKLLDDANLFSINGSVDLMLTDKVDYESFQSITIFVECIDNGVPPLSIKQSLTFDILDSNDAPSAINSTIYSVPENADSDQLVAELIIEDQDKLQSHICEAVGPTKDWYYFTNETSRKIFMFLNSERVKLNYEVNQIISVDLVCHDNGIPSLSIGDVFEFPVTDVNEPSTRVTILNSTLVFLDENAVAGTVVGWLECDDPDDGEPVYLLLDDSSRQFKIEQGNLIVQNLTDFDFESSVSNTINVSIQVSDTSLHPVVFNGTLQIVANDVNEPPFDLRLVINGLKNDTVSISENTKIGSPIGQLWANNPEGSRQNLIFSLLNYEDYFRIDNDSSSMPDLILTKKLDSNTINISLQVRDDGKPSCFFTGYITIIIISYDPCINNTLNCVSNSTCGVRNNSIAAECLCFPGFEMQDGSCQQIDECKPSCDYCFAGDKEMCESKKKPPCSPCFKNSVCTDLHLNYSCKCESGFTGLDCSIAVDGCASQPCFFNSTCENKVNGYLCHCRDGYWGVNCEKEINECENETCRNGKCIDLIDGFHCSCADNFYGIFCERDSRMCSPGKCSNQFECVPQIIPENGVLCVPKDRIASVVYLQSFAVLSPNTEVSLWKLRFVRFLREKVKISRHWIDSQSNKKEPSEDYSIDDSEILYYGVFDDRNKTTTFNVSSTNKSQTMVRFFAVVGDEVLPVNVLLFSINKTCEKFYSKCSKYDKKFGCRLCNDISEFLSHNHVLIIPPVESSIGDSKKSSSNFTLMTVILFFAVCLACILVIFGIVFFRCRRKTKKSRSDKKLTYSDFPMPVTIPEPSKECHRINNLYETSMNIPVKRSSSDICTHNDEISNDEPCSESINPLYGLPETHYLKDSKNHQLYYSISLLEENSSPKTKASAYSNLLYDVLPTDDSSYED